MKNLWIWMIAVTFFIPIVVGISCSHKTEKSTYRSQRQEAFKIPEMPPLPPIYGTLAEDYLGTWKYKSNCGDDHNGKGSHDITGVISFKDNSHFTFEFVTTEVLTDSIVYQVKRDGYWTLSSALAFINMAVVHEINSKMEITIIDPEAVLKIYFKVFLDDTNTGQYKDEYQRLYDFNKVISVKKQRNGLKRV